MISLLLHAHACRHRPPSPPNDSRLRPASSSPRRPGEPPGKPPPHPPGAWKRPGLWSRRAGSKRGWPSCGRSPRGPPSMPTCCSSSVSPRSGRRRGPTFGRAAGGAARRSHCRLPHHADRPPGPLARPPRARPRLLLQARGRPRREHFERVLAGDLPPPVVANVQDFLRAIRARKRWRVYFGAALAPDSNIGSASDERFIQIHVLGTPLPFRREQEELTTSRGGSLPLDGRRVPAPPR